MPDMTAITSGLSALKTATDIVKYLRSAEKELEAAEFKLKLAELSESLAEVKLQLVDAQEENSHLQREIRDLKTKRNFRSEIRVRDNVYFPIDGELAGYGRGPWCTKALSPNNLTSNFVAAQGLPRGRIA